MPIRSHKATVKLDLTLWSHDEQLDQEAFWHAAQDVVTELRRVAAMWLGREPIKIQYKDHIFEMMDIEVEEPYIGAGHDTVTLEDDHLKDIQSADYRHGSST